MQISNMIQVLSFLVFLRIKYLSDNSSYSLCKIEAYSTEATQQSKSLKLESEKLHNVSAKLQQKQYVDSEASYNCFLKY